MRFPIQTVSLSSLAAMLAVGLFCLLTALAGCSDAEPPKIRTEGYMVGSGWVETSRHIAAGKIYIRMDRDGEYRWFVTDPVTQRTRYLLTTEDVPQ